jgi:hypothetical protein
MFDNIQSKIKIPNRIITSAPSKSTTLVGIICPKFVALLSSIPLTDYTLLILFFEDSKAVFFFC